MATSTQPIVASSIPAYKTAFLQSCLSANVLTFGLAYKGIGLAILTLRELWVIDPQTWSSVSYSTIRKEAKDHGEGGDVVGASLKGKNVLVTDDVITAGTAMRETTKSVAKEGGKVVGFVVALDRIEKMSGSKENDGEPRMSAMGQIKREFGVPTASIVTLDDLLAMLRGKGDKGDIERLEEYRKRYLASD